MFWLPPANPDGAPLRARLPESGWREAIELIAAKHAVSTSDLERYEMGETIVWRAGDHVIKLTQPECAYQVEAEVGCLGATHGRLSVETPRLVAHGNLSGWPYLIMSRIAGRPLAAVWSEFDHERRLRFARRLGLFTRELHALPHTGFPAIWPDFRRRFCTDIDRRHAASGATAEQLAWLRALLTKVGDLSQGPLVPLHTELIGQHLYVDERGGRLELTGLIDFADAMLGPAPYEFGALVGFVFQGERGLLREYLLGYGFPEADLTPRYSETLLAWSLHHRFSSLARTLAMLEPLGLSSLDEIARVLYSLEPG